MRKINVSVSEMLELRKQGYGNHDIAAMLDISKATVARYIGKQGGRMERLAAFKDKPITKPEAAPADVIPPYAPKIVKEIYTIGDSENPIGIEALYEDSLIAISDGNRYISLSFAQAGELVRFLAWFSREKYTGAGSLEEK